jgi:hypothetical protein
MLICSSWVPYTLFVIPTLSDELIADFFTSAGQGYALPWFLPANATHLVKKIAYDGIVEGLLL